MGTVDSRCQHEHGYLFLQTSKQFYYVGEQVQGTIYMRVTKPVEAKHMEIQVRGKEKASFMETVQRDGQTHHEKRKHNKEILNYAAPCFIFT